MDLSSDVVAWRAHQRAQLIARRSAVSPGDRDSWNRAITRLLVDGFPCLEGMVVGFCWPFKAEFDARLAMRHFRSRGAVAVLPVVVRKNAPLEFRVWTPQAHTVPGVFGLPVPQRTPVVRPDALLIPPVGFGSQGYRLGYGGGYFDRTLAAMRPQPLKIGVAFEVSRMPTIYPQAHDVPMDFIVTERGIHGVSATGLVRYGDAREVRRAVAALSRERSCEAGGGSAQPDLQPVTAMRRVELLALLNQLLAAERAGAKAISAHMAACEPGTRLWLRLNTVQRDASMNCAVLIDLIRGLGAAPAPTAGSALRDAYSPRTGDEPLVVLNRGQDRVVQLLRASLRRVGDPIAKAALKRILVGHVVNMDRCGRLIGKPERLG